MYDSQDQRIHLVQQESEERLKLALSSANAGVWDWNPRTRCARLSPECFEILGLNSAHGVPGYREWLGRIVDADDRAHVRQTLKRVLCRNGPNQFTLEYRISHPEKGLRWLSAPGRIEREAGRVVRMVGLNIDITDRKETEVQLQRMQHMLAEGQRIAHLGSWEYIAATEELVWSDEEKRIFGLDPSEPAPSYQSMLRRWIHPDDAAQVELLFREAFEKRAVFENENRIVLPNGSIRWIYNRALPYFDRSGRLVKFMGTTLDITDRKANEAALRESEEQLRLSTEAGEIGTFSVDLKTHVVLYSAKVAGMVGLPLSETATLEEALTRVHRDDIAEIRRHIDAALDPQGDGRFKFELRFVRPGGGTRWLMWSGRVEFAETPAGRSARRVLGVCVDTTERNQLLAELAEANSDLERKVAERTAALALEMEGREEAQSRLAHAQRLEATGRLASGLAHDFNNTLAAVAAHLEFVEPRITDAKIRESVRAALDAVELGASLNRRLLSLASRRHNFQHIITLSEPLTAIVSLISRTLGHDVVVSSNLEDKLWGAKLDPGELESAILNLAINARDAMPAGGELVISARKVELDHASFPGASNATAGDHIRISVRDSGIGMTPEILARAGEPFFTTKCASKGTGLGLSSVREFVSRVGGFMTIDSSPAAGTEVALYLPRACESAPQSAARDVEEVCLGNGELVLLIDDNERVLEATHKLLEGLGYAVVSARSGAEAMAFIHRGEPIDVVLSDVVMPDMSGFDVAREIRAKLPGLKVLLFSGGSDAASNSGDQFHRSVDGMAILRKPYTRLQLGQALWSAIHGSGAASSSRSTVPAKA